MFRKFILSLLIAFTNAICFAQNDKPILQSIPSSFQDPEYGLGVSACYAGILGDKIIIAGGANFPTPGKKKYYSTIYAAEIKDNVLQWEEIGQLPKPLAYGVSVCSGDSLIFIGGCNADGSSSDVFSFHLDRTSEKAIIHSLPSVPCTLDNAYGAYYNNKVYIVGGNKDGKSSTEILCFDLSANKWNVECNFTGVPRVQPVCSCFKGKLYIFGGFYMNGEDSHVATDGYCYDIKTKDFHHIDAPTDSDGNELTLSGGVAISYKGKIYCTGGVNKDIFLDAISGRYNLVKQTEYLNQPVEWYKFNGSLFAFEPKKEKWEIVINSPHSLLSRAGAVVLMQKSSMFYIGGELKPGVRTSETIRVFL